MDKRDTESDTGTSSQDFEAGDFDRLSGFFTPVWERRFKGANSPAGASRSKSLDVHAEREAMSEAKSRSLRAARAATEVHQLLRDKGALPDENAAGDDSAPAAIRSQGKAEAESSASPSADASTANSQAALVRRLRRTVRLYAPLPERVLQRLAKS